MERSSITIHQLGHSLGFNDPAHFSSFFKRMTGMAPSRYRELMAKSAGRRAEPAAEALRRLAVSLLMLVPAGRRFRGRPGSCSRAWAAGRSRGRSFRAAITQRRLRAQPDRLDRVTRIQHDEARLLGRRSRP